MEQDLSSVIKNIKDLKAEYDRLSAQPLSHDAMEAYRCWYEHLAGSLRTIVGNL